MTEIENHHFTITIVITDSGKYQWILRILNERLLGKIVTVWQYHPTYYLLIRKGKKYF